MTYIPKVAREAKSGLDIIGLFFLVASGQKNNQCTPLLFEINLTSDGIRFVEKKELENRTRKLSPKGKGLVTLSAIAYFPPLRSQPSGSRSGPKETCLPTARAIPLSRPLKTTLCSGRTAYQ